MAKVILEHKLKELSILGHFTVESAARDAPSSTKASPYAREAIKMLYGEDLLAGYKPKSLTPELIEKADLILVMTADMKHGLPLAKTYTVTEYGGGAGDIMDPYGSDLGCYLKCAKELSKAIDNVVARDFKTKS
jgi:protein-tyrosine-phosphatase